MNERGLTVMLLYSTAIYQRRVQRVISHWGGEAKNMLRRESGSIFLPSQSERWPFYRLVRKERNTVANRMLPQGRG